MKKAHQYLQEPDHRQDLAKAEQAVSVLLRAGRLKIVEWTAQAVSDLHILSARLCQHVSGAAVSPMSTL